MSVYILYMYMCVYVSVFVYTYEYYLHLYLYETKYAFILMSPTLSRYHMDHPNLPLCLSITSPSSLFNFNKS